jgi:hypothetical protein
MENDEPAVKQDSKNVLLPTLFILVNNGVELKNVFHWANLFARTGNKAT